jgi:hypothetical protein
MPEDGETGDGRRRVSRDAHSSLGCEHGGRSP